MNDEPDEPWKQLVQAARKSRAEAPPEHDATAPPQFVTRIRTMRKSLWRIARTILWRRWSLVAIVLAILTYLIVYLVLDRAPTPAIPTPEPPDPRSL